MASRNQLLIVYRGGHSTSATITLNGLARGVLQHFDRFSFDTQPNRDDLFGGSRSGRDDLLRSAQRNRRDHFRGAPPKSGWQTLRFIIYRGDFFEGEIIVM